MENETDKTVNRFKMDNGLEFCPKMYNNFCKQHDIVRHRMIVGIPQQNDLVERDSMKPFWK